MREDLAIEKRMKHLLADEFGEAQGQEIFSDYVQVRKYVYTQIAEEIKAKIPNHSDHGPRHIDNVLRNIDFLLGDVQISAANLYILCLSTLFHDLGNLHGREGHNRKIDEIYFFVRGNQNRQEQKAVYLIAGAHTGEAKDGSNDSLKDVPDHLSLFGKEIFPRKNAAILRFADELAEGPQRTSVYMQEHGGYKEGKSIYHHYANVVSIEISRKLERISVYYHIPLLFNHNIKIKTGKDTAEDFVKFRDFIFYRFNKLDQERKYCKHYCDWLNPFRSSIATLDFWDGSHLIDLDLPPIELTDLIIPEGCQNNILKCYPQYDEDAIIKSLTERHQWSGGGDDRI